MNISIIFGGMSTEHNVSNVSGTSIIKNLNKTKYNITPIYIDKNGNWFKYTKDINQIDILDITDEPTELEPIDNIFDILKEQDVVFPVMHGKYGEDGTIQGLLELLHIPYVGCKVLASSIAMDKVYTKVIIDKAGIKQTKSEYIRKFNDKYIYVDKEFNERVCTIDEVCNIIEQNIKYPMFIKPSNSGSSVGVTKVTNTSELKQGINYAGKYDSKILVEQGIQGHEVECAVLGNEEVIASNVGEIKAADNFYSFDAKYNNQESRTLIPAEITEEQVQKVRNLAVKAFKAIDGRGLSRADFFVEDGTGEIYLNEINTLPGFTTISMYPKLFESVRNKIF